MSIDYTRKQPLVPNLLGAVDWRVKTAMAQQGHKLPCQVVSFQNNVVTVQFQMNQNCPLSLPNITIPIIGPEYIRYPIQVGDIGFTISADVSLGYASQIDGSQTPPNFSNYGNLSSVLVFVPISSVKWSASEDPSSVLIYGPNGVVLRDAQKKATVTINKDSGITLKYGSNKVVVDSSGITITGTLTINGKAYTAHQHTGVQPGSGITGGLAP